MDYLKLALRLIHITGGVFWVGSSLVTAFFVGPAVAATGEAGQKMIGHLMNKGRLSVAISIAAVLTVLAGIALYWIDSDGFTSAWQKSGPGIMFGIGGFFAIIGLIFGMLVGKNMSVMARVGTQIQGKPTDEQISQIQAAQKRLGFVGPISTFSQLIALVCMALARYWM